MSWGKASVFATFVSRYRSSIVRVEGRSVPKYQRPLSYEEKQTLKAVAMQRELDNQMGGTTIGREGLSPNILGNIAKILARDELVKVYLKGECIEQRILTSR